jgi:hypothetical protein
MWLTSVELPVTKHFWSEKGKQDDMVVGNGISGAMGHLWISNEPGYFRLHSKLPNQALTSVFYSSFNGM